MKSKNQFWSLFAVTSLVLSVSLVPVQKSWASPESEFIAAKKVELAQKKLKVTEDFVNLAFKKKCTTQYNAIEAESAQAKSQSIYSTWVAFETTGNTSFQNSMVGCENVDWVVGLCLASQASIDTLISELLSDVEKFVTSPPTAMTREKKFEGANTKIKHAFILKITALRILKDLEKPADVVPVKSSSESTTVVTPAITTSSSNQGATKVQVTTKEETKSVSVSVEEPKKVGKSTTRCQHVGCAAKLPRFPLTCKCGGDYCGSHRLPTDHKCTFDHKANQQKKIVRENPVVKSDSMRGDRL